VGGPCGSVLVKTSLLPLTFGNFESKNCFESAYFRLFKSAAISFNGIDKSINSLYLSQKLANLLIVLAAIQLCCGITALDIHGAQASDKLALLLVADLSVALLELVATRKRSAQRFARTRCTAITANLVGARFEAFIVQLSCKWSQRVQVLR